MESKKLYEVPKGVKCELPEHSKSMTQDVIGDGSCCLRCIALHLGLPEEQGPALSSQLNKHIIKHRQYFANKLIFPKTVYKGMGTMEERFGDSKEEVERFFNWLATEEAQYMWREEWDIVAAANYWNMTIEVIKVDSDGNMLMPPQVYRPPEDFVWAEGEKSELKPKMILLNKPDHYNLILKQKETKQTHEKEIVSEETYICDTCETTESSKKALKEHRVRYHAGEIIREQQREIEDLKRKIKITVVQTVVRSHLLGMIWDTTIQRCTENQQKISQIISSRKKTQTKQFTKDPQQLSVAGL